MRAVATMSEINASSDMDHMCVGQKDESQKKEFGVVPKRIEYR
jgi:hypothetical protein